MLFHFDSFKIVITLFKILNASSPIVVEVGRQELGEMYCAILFVKIRILFIDVTYNLEYNCKYKCTISH